VTIADRDRKLLWGRAAGRCALCQERLSVDPRHPSDGHAVLGQECHIVARRPGGPRAGEIETESLDGYDNLILLCATHHKLVDDQPHEYSSERLRSIKLAHEQRVTTPGDGGAEQPRVWFNVPHDPRHFVGRRAELDALGAAFDGAAGSPSIRVITGLGGIGKSQLAARYAHQSRDRYSVIAWIRADDGGLADLSSLAVELGEPVAGLSAQERASIALRRLSSASAMWLLVLDNVASPHDIAGCCPSAGNGRVLITTRHRELEQFGVAVALGIFDDETGTEYLRVRAHRPDDPDARPLAKALGGLPLALSHAGAYCATGTSFAAYRRMLGDLPAEDVFDACPEVSYEQTVGSTWQISIAAACDRAALARPILQMVAYLASDQIPRHLLEVLVDGAERARAQKALGDAMNALHRLCLIDVDDQVISVHRLLQKVIRDADCGDRRSARLALAALVDAFPLDPAQPTTWPVCEQLVLHTFALADNFGDPGDDAGRLVELLNRVCRYLNWAERGERAAEAAFEAAHHAQCLLGDEHPATLHARRNLSAAYHWTGRSTDALTIQRPLVADCDRILGREHVETLHARNNLASLYRSDDAPHAISILEPLVTDCTQMLGAEHAETLSARANLAASYCCVDRVDEAIAIEERVAAQRELLLGRRHPDTLRALHNLAYSYEQAGRLAEAVELGERVLADTETILGDEHPATLRARSNLTFAYRSIGRIADAIRLGEMVLAQRERILGRQHPETASARTSLERSRRAAADAAELAVRGSR
jgi:tetratricopeptide (TPR) repeat protein